MNSLPFMIHLPCLLLGFAWAGSASAQSAIDWFTADAGGAAAASANYVIDYTLGQGDAATLTSANYTIVGGFWALVDLGPASGLPQLHVTPGSPGNVLLSWPSPSTSYVLQENLNLSNPAGWTDVAGLVSDDGTLKTITRPVSGSTRYYRLRKP